MLIVNNEVSRHASQELSSAEYAYLSDTWCAAAVRQIRGISPRRPVDSLGLHSTRLWLSSLISRWAYTRSRHLTPLTTSPHADLHVTGRTLYTLHGTAGLRHDRMRSGMVRVRRKSAEYKVTNAEKKQVCVEPFCRLSSYTHLLLSAGACCTAHAARPQISIAGCSPAAFAAVARRDRQTDVRPTVTQA